MAGASAAFSALKKGMQMGKDLHQMSGQYLSGQALCLT